MDIEESWPSSLPRERLEILYQLAQFRAQHTNKGGKRGREDVEEDPKLEVIAEDAAVPGLSQQTMNYLEAFADPVDDDEKEDLLRIKGVEEIDASLGTSHSNVVRNPAPHLTKGTSRGQGVSQDPHDPASFEYFNMGNRIPSTTYSDPTSLSQHQEAVSIYLRDLLLKRALIEETAMGKDDSQSSVHNSYATTMRLTSEDGSKADAIARDVVKCMPASTAGALGRFPDDGWD